MSYHYVESGLDNVWLDNGYIVEDHPNYGRLVSFTNVRGLHEAISRWLIDVPRTLTGAEFRFLRVEMDMSQKALAGILGVTDQAVAKWEKARGKSVANKAAERLLRVLYREFLEGSSDIGASIRRLAELDAALAEQDLHLSRQQDGWKKAA